MGRIIFILLVIVRLGLSQILTEQFNNFINYDSVDSLYAYYIYDGTALSQVSGAPDSVYQDWTSNNIDWTATPANKTRILANLSATPISSPIYNGGQVFRSQGVASTATAAAAVLKRINDLGVSDFTVIFSFYLTGNATLENVFRYYTYSNQPYIYPRLTYSSSWTRIAIMLTDGSTPLSVVATGYATPYNRWNVASISVDRDANLVIYNNDDVAATSDISGNSSVNITNAAANGILYLGNAAETANSFCSWAIYLGKSLSAEETKRTYMLASGWSTKKDNVYRNPTSNSWEFAQGFFDGDTLYHAVSDTSNQSGYHWQSTFDAYGGKSGDAVTMYLGGGTPITQVLTATSASYTVSLGTVTTSSDSLYMIASVGDTVYVDNLVVTEAIDATTETTKRKFGSYGGWGGW